MSIYCNCGQEKINKYRKDCCFFFYSLLAVWSFFLWSVPSYRKWTFTYTTFHSCCGQEKINTLPRRNDNWQTPDKWKSIGLPHSHSESCVNKVCPPWCPLASREASNCGWVLSGLSYNPTVKCLDQPDLIALWLTVLSKIFGNKHTVHH